MPDRHPARISTRKTAERTANNLKVLREEQLLTKAELARKAGVSALTVSRIENGCDCRMDTKRKIILALGLEPSDKAKVFGGSATGRRRS